LQINSIHLHTRQLRVNQLYVFFPIDSNRLTDIQIFLEHLYVHYRKGEPEKGSVISQKSLATFISMIIEHPVNYVGENLGVNKPNS